MNYVGGFLMLLGLLAMGVCLLGLGLALIGFGTGASLLAVAILAGWAGAELIEAVEVQA